VINAADFAVISDAIAERGWIICPDFISAETLHTLRQHLFANWRAGKLQPAGIGRGQQSQVRTDIRGDSRCWLEASDKRLSAYFSVMQTLRETLNAALYLGLWELETHFSVYPAGAVYQRHRDSFNDILLRPDTERVLSTVLYLNETWQESDGGILRLYLDAGQTLDISPQGGTLVLFLSASFDHEVLPATRERFSIAGWFKRRIS